MAATTWKSREASEKQVAFIQRLLAERSLDGLAEELLDRAADVESGIAIKGGEASTMIDRLLAQPKKPRKPGAEAKPGYYTKDGEVFVVVQNRAKTHTYAKQMIISTDAGGAKRGRWEYRPGLGARLATSVPLTVTEAARLGHLHGVCMICGAALTDPESVTRGIGPICAKRVK